MTVGELKIALAGFDESLKMFIRTTPVGFDLVIFKVSVIASFKDISAGGITVPSGSLTIT